MCVVAHLVSLVMRCVAAVRCCATAMRAFSASTMPSHTVHTWPTHTHTQIEWAHSHSQPASHVCFLSLWRVQVGPYLLVGHVEKQV